jgi:hypothetical protein
MNSMALPQPTTRSRRVRLSDAAWDGFDAPRRNRRSAAPLSAGAHSKATLRHAHLTFAETPEMYLREEMS